MRNEEGKVRSEELEVRSDGMLFYRKAFIVNGSIAQQCKLKLLTPHSSLLTLSQKGLL